MQKKNILFLFLILFVSLSTSVFARNYTCSICGTEFTRGGFTDGKNIYCGNCAEILLEQGDYYTDDKPSVKVKEKPSVKVENKINTNSSGNRIKAGQSKCSVCKKLMVSGRYYLTLDDRPVCENCSNKYSDRCMTCNIPVPLKTGARYGSYITCDKCSKDIIVTKDQLRQVFNEICVYMKREFGLTVPVKPENVKFSDMSIMSDMIRYNMYDVPEEYGENTIGLFSQDEMVIYIQKGMSRITVCDILTHESAHSWMYKYGKSGADLLFTEGFAEWCSYKYLTNMGKTKYLKDKMERESDLYNEGLSKMIKLEKQIGTSKITEYVRTHNRLPKN